MIPVAKQETTFKVIYKPCEFNETLYAQGIQTLIDIIFEVEPLCTEGVSRENVQRSIAVN